MMSVVPTYHHRIALIDRTQQDAQFHNQRRQEPFPTKNKVHEIKIVRTYTHNPYFPVEMRDVDVETSACTADTPYTSPSLGQVPRIVYVNGRPMVLPTNTSSPQDTSVQDISFETCESEATAEEGEEELAPEEELVTVQFHQHRALYFCDIDPSLGDFVVVRGDRGYDVGRVVAKAPKATHVADPKKPDVLWVKSLATPEEIRQAQTEQIAHEENALHVIRQAVHYYNLPMTVKSCEAQFDRKKLSFYFEAKTKVDFRKLLKAMHAQFGVRIWLHQINRQLKKGEVPEDANMGCY